MILPSDTSEIPQPGFRSDFVGWLNSTRSNRARYRIHQPGYIFPSHPMFDFLFLSKILANVDKIHKSLMLFIKKRITIKFDIGNYQDNFFKTLI